MADALSRTAKDFPSTKFALLGAGAEGSNIVSVTFKEQEGAYLAGHLAGKITRTGKTLDLWAEWKFPRSVVLRLVFNRGLKKPVPGFRRRFDMPEILQPPLTMP